MPRQTYLLNRKGYYYFRIVIPHDLQGRFGRRELITSLKTTQYQDASKRCATLVSKVYGLFEFVREEMALNTEEIREISRELTEDDFVLPNENAIEKRPRYYKKR